MSEHHCLCLSARQNKIVLTEHYYSSQATAKILELKWTVILSLIKKKILKVDVKGRTVMISRSEILRLLQLMKRK